MSGTWNVRVSTMAAGLALILAGCAESTTANGGSDDDPITIGAVLDITGAGASLGLPERKTLEMLTEAANESGGINGRQIELIVEDNQSKEDTAAKVTSKLINEDDVDILIGASRTGPSLAMRPIAESAQTPMISLAASSRIIEGSKWVFKTAQNDDIVLEKMIDHAVEEGWSTLALIRDASAYGDEVGETLAELGSAHGIELVGTEKFDPDSTDFTAQMINIRKANADANIIWGIPPAAALAVQAYRQAGIDRPMVLGHGVANQQFLDIAAESADGALVPQGRLLVADTLPDDDPQRKVIQSFVEDYAAAHDGESPSPFASYAYDAFQLAVAALEAGGSDKAQVREHLENTEGLVATTGIFTMSPDDHSGLDKSALVMVTVDDGAWTLRDTDG